MIFRISLYDGHWERTSGATKNTFITLQSSNITCTMSVLVLGDHSAGFTRICSNIQSYPPFEDLEEKNLIPVDDYKMHSQS